MKITYSMMLLLLANALAAQNVIPNPDFENWEDGGGFFNSYEDPVDWGTLNSVSALLGVNTVTKTTQSQFVKSGNAALRLETYNIPLLNRPAQGLCVTGTINTDTEEVEGGIAFDARPDAFSGWYQYYPSGTDTASVVALFTKWNTFTNQRDTVGLAAQWITEQVAVYSLFEIPVDYYSELTPDSLLIILVCSSQTNPSIGTVMYIDALSFNFSTSIALNDGLEHVSMFPNPTSSYIMVQNDNSFAMMQVRNMAGTLVKKVNLLSGSNQVHVDDLPSGTYLSQFVNQSGKTVGTSKWIISR